MSLKGRALQRGKQLDKDCYIAKISSNEYGPGDDRKFCYGIVDCSTDDHLEKCRECRAFAWNAKPPEKEGNYVLFN